MSNLTVAELREHFETDLPTAALQRVIDGVEAEIAAIIGEPGERTMSFSGLEKRIFFSQPIASISAISERVYDTTTVLDPTDYSIDGNGYWIERQTTDAVHPSSYWGHRVTVTFTPKPADAKVKMATIDMCKLELQFNGTLFETAGSSQTQVGDWLKVKNRILASLNRRIGVA